MINIIRKEEEPNCLSIEKQKEIDKIKKNGIVDCGKGDENVRVKLKKDFLNKCYICESRGIVSEIDHFKPWIGENIDLKFEWNNLFYSCGYCNGKKSSVYNNSCDNMILDCTNPKEDVENCLIYKKAKNLKSKFDISVAKEFENDNKVLKTAEFLNKIYNGNEKRANTDTLKENILYNLKIFQENVRKYFEKIDNTKYEKRIIFELSKRSPFTAFKRQIIKDKKKLHQFKKYFD